LHRAAGDQNPRNKSCESARLLDGRITALACRQIRPSLVEVLSDAFPDHERDRRSGLLGDPAQLVELPKIEVE
jgi:hypothetical protein